MRERIHDRELLDALEQIEPVNFDDTVWRVVRDGRDPIQTLTTGSGGRWDDGQFEVLYTSLDRDTAISEVYYNLSRQPIFPGSINYFLFELAVSTKRTLQFLDVGALAPFSIEASIYNSKDYLQLKSEIYPVTQAIGAAAHFLEFDGLIVPSGRVISQNLVLFLDKVTTITVTNSQKKEKVHWERSRR